jgi:membrane protease YdiL (CAAX protease family)
MLFFILWIFTSLSKTLEKLQARKRYAKLELYRKFTNALALAVIIAVLWIGYELYFKATDKFSERWESAWTISAFWIIFTFVLLIVICLLWAPSQNSTRFAYSEDVGEDYDEEAVALTSSGAAAENEKTSAKTDQRKPVNTDVFSLDDDPEEDKRE